MPEKTQSSPSTQFVHLETRPKNNQVPPALEGLTFISLLLKFQILSYSKITTLLKLLLV